MVAINQFVINAIGSCKHKPAKVYGNFSGEIPHSDTNSTNIAQKYVKESHRQAIFHIFKASNTILCIWIHSISLQSINFVVMNIPSKHIEEAVEQLASLPSIGKRSALRLVLHLLKRSPEEIERFAQAFVTMKSEVKQCTSCGNISDKELCAICLNPNRDTSLICVVEDIRDIMAIEATSSYKGIYHVLGGIISPMDGIGPSDLNIDTLIAKAENEEISEIIFALSATMEGDTTNFYLYKKLKDFDFNISTLSRGVAVGSELQYADELTLGRSIMQRLPFESTFQK